MLRIPDYKDNKVLDPKEPFVGGNCIRFGRWWGWGGGGGGQCARQPWKGNSSQGEVLELEEASSERKC